jgi:hypothetical protein
LEGNIKVLQGLENVRGVPTVPSAPILRSAAQVRPPAASPVARSPGRPGPETAAAGPPAASAQLGSGGGGGAAGSAWWWWAGALPGGPAARAWPQVAKVCCSGPRPPQ